MVTRSPERARPASPADVAALRARAAELELVPFDDHEAAWAPALGLEARAAAAGAEDVERRARLVQADVMLRRGQTAEAVARIRAVHAWAEERGDAHLLARAHRFLYLVFERAGQPPRALGHAVRAVQTLPADSHPRLRAEHLTTLAIAQARTGSLAAARERFVEVERFARGLGDVSLQLASINNLAFAAHRMGRLDLARAEAARLTALGRRHGRPLCAQYLDTVAQVHIAAGELEEAEELLRRSIEEAEHLRHDRVDECECLLTLARVSRLRGRHARAQECLDEVERRSAGFALATVRTPLLAERAELHAAAGRYREAYLAHRAYHASVEALRNAEDEASARILAAVFETEEARRTGRRWREMSLEDPLTGLHNRRYLDEQLPALLGQADADGASVCVAVLDLDHFKRINDERSHEAGDLVLRRVAGLLRTFLPDGGLVVRMGGEEFLMAWAGEPAPEATRRCERLLAGVAAGRWDDLVGSLPVTASVGLVVAGPGSQAYGPLLAEADRHLYAAKRGGRDRVVTGTV